jgi:hypothetical protein
VYLVVVAAIVGGCPARHTLPYGRYEDFAGPGVVKFTSYGFHFQDARSVVYTFWSDAGNSRYGKGQYQITKDKLILTFDGTSPLPSDVQVSTKETSRDSLELNFRVKAAFRDGTQMLSGIIIGVYDAAGNVITGDYTKEDGMAKLLVARASGPKRVRLGSIGWQQVEYQLQDANTVLSVHLQPDFGTVYDAGTRITFGIVAISDTRMVLRRGKDRMVFLKK